MQDGAPSRAQQIRAVGVLLAKVGAVVVISAIAVLLAVRIANRYVVFDVEEGPGYRWVRVRSPLGSFTAQAFPKGYRSLWAAVYSRPEPQQQVDTDWYRGPAGEEERVARLTVFRFQIRSSLAQAEGSYQKGLGSNFTRSAGWPVGAQPDTEEWVRQILSQSSSGAVVFRQQLPGRVRGVVLQAQPGANGVLVTLYDYQETSRQ